ncbi:Diacylglycerol kinase [Marasmius crinis-equi]|uniref:Diacylglycerol kinase n=1 Tax=Marasmius crinis-equi TaxID=585013 RepID=A0ABR3G1W8_9AGAR
MPVTVIENKPTIQPSYIGSHDLPPPPPRRKASQHPTMGSRTLSQRSTSSAKTQSSASPVPTSPPTFKRRRSLSAEPGGVQSITRKVIKKLEELSGHPDEVEGEDNESDRSDDKDVEGEEREEVVNELLTESIGGVHGTGSVSSAKVVVVGPSASVPKKVDWEIPRKVLHSSIGFFTIYLYVSQGNPNAVVLVLWSALAVIAPADFLRLRFPKFERLYEKCLGFLMRESEKHTTNGVTWYIIGVNFALMFYPLDVATVAILILSWADTAASTIGRLWGYLTPRLPTHIPLIPFSPVRLPLAPRKSLAGFLAAFATGSAIAAGFWGWMAPMRTNKDDITWWFDGGVSGGQPGYSFGGWIGLALISVCAGMISAVAEALDLGSLDDNLTLPIISGGCLFGLFKLLGVASSWLQV